MADSASNATIQVRGLRVIRGKAEVLDGLDLDIAGGQVTGLLGPSGCGKTTLMRSIVGVQKVADGSVTVLGEAAGSASLRSRVGYVTQAASVYDDLTVAQNVTYFSRILGAPDLDIDRAIDQVGLRPHVASMVRDLSGGERSRASLAVALLGKPEVLVLDEPTVGLDPLLRRELWGLFKQLAASGTTLLVSSHVMDEATRCDRLVLMRDGAVLAHDTLPGLLAYTGTADIEQAFLKLVEQEVA